MIFAEGQAARRVAMTMKNWIEKLDGFLKLNDRDILQNAGKISHELAKEIAEKEYEKFNQKRVNQDGDFEKIVGLVEKNKRRKSGQKN